MFDITFSWSWFTLIALGSFHGLNPAMGWLFAVALGIQERRAGAVVGALWPIAIGHAAAIAAVAGAVIALGEVIPRHILMVAGGVSMLGFAGYKIISKFRHPASVGMRAGGRELVAWSFIMATGHGAGLMLIPALLEIGNGSVPSAAAHEGHHVHGMHVATESTVSLAHSLAAVGVHTAAMFAVAGVLALLVYSRVGVDVIRHAWINVDVIWIGAMAIVGFVTVGMGVWPSIAR